jgi:two-component system response regulator
MKNGRNLLLIEDNPDDEALTIRAFRKNNVVGDIHVARDGQEAIDYLFGADGRPPAALPALILLDLHLPKIEGLDVLRRIRAEERTRLLPVVILTSSNEERDLVNGYRLGANSYVRKPVDFSDFVQAAAQLGMYWLMLNQAPPQPA